ncbi:MAG: dTDP-4-dehydrorhamnose reductase [Desulfovibrionaceae bacterium]|nr:dTDP-4-dehydrorhamnose reductase [Desulfovibrionaceae bacterium]
MLGQALVRAAEARGWLVHTLGREDGPVSSPDWLEARMAEIQPCYVFNAIAYTAVDDAEDHADEAYALNKSFPDLLGRMVRGSATHLVHYGTDFVFNGKAHAPYTEDDATEPLSVYGASKLAGEQALLAAAPDNACVLRTAWLFGPGRKNFVSTMLRLAASSPCLTVVHDQVGSPTFTTDLAAMSLALAEIRATGVIHAVNGGQASWCELASEAVSLVNANAQVRPITSGQWPQKARRPAYSVLDTSRLTQLTGIRPRPWPQALRDYIFQSFAPRSEDH